MIWQSNISQWNETSDEIWLPENDQNDDMKSQVVHLRLTFFLKTFALQHHFAAPLG